MDNKINNYSCCVIGHRKIDFTNKRIEKVKQILEDLILNSGVCDFLFGSNSQFNDLCYNLILQLKEKYPYIKTIFYPTLKEMPKLNDINKGYDGVVVKDYVHHTDYKYSYVLRNKSLIDDSDICLFYYNSSEMLLAEGAGYKVKSGTKIAYEYAQYRDKKIINII